MPRVCLILSVVSLAALAAPALADCGAVLHANELLKPGAHVIVGEVHGTVETPRVVGDLVCLAAGRGPVRLGVEMSIDEQPPIDTYLKSAGSPADRRALFEGKWTSEFQDGTRSVAMVDLIESVRKLRQASRDVGVVAFSNPKRPTADRDLVMAQNLLQAFASEPKAIFVVLTGNVHAQRRSREQKQSLMAAWLVELGATITTLDSHYGIGSSWACWALHPEATAIDPKQVRCGPAVIGEGSGASPAIVLGRTKDAAYDGLLEVGAASYSPPAAVPITKEQQAHAIGIGHRVEARRAYDAKAYARCAEVSAALAHEEHAMDDAYNAACCFALAKNLDRAFEQLGLAIDLGFKDAAGLQKDDDLISLRSDARWKAVVARLSNSRVH